MAPENGGLVRIRKPNLSCPCFAAQGLHTAAAGTPSKLSQHAVYLEYELIVLAATEANVNWFVYLPGSRSYLYGDPRALLWVGAVLIFAGSSVRPESGVIQIQIAITILISIGVSSSWWMQPGEVCFQVSRS